MIQKTTYVIILCFATFSYLNVYASSKCDNSKKVINQMIELYINSDTDILDDIRKIELHLKGELKKASKIRKNSCQIGELNKSLRFFSDNKSYLKSIITKKKQFVNSDRSIQVPLTQNSISNNSVKRENLNNLEQIKVNTEPPLTQNLISNDDKPVLVNDNSCNREDLNELERIRENIQKNENKIVKINGLITDYNTQRKNKVISEMRRKLLERGVDISKIPQEQLFALSDDIGRQATSDMHDYELSFQDELTFLKKSIELDQNMLVTLGKICK